MEPKKEEIDEEKVKKLFLEKSTKLKTSPPKNIKFDNNQKLKFYGLYKVSTVGKYSENNKLKAGFFDFETKYKNQAWEKCSIYSPIEAMIEYIKYYCELTGEKCDLNFSKNKISINDLSLDIPNLESQSLYSSNAKESLLEKEKFLEKASLEEKKFQSLKDDIYNGEIITEEILNKFESDNKINLLSFRDTIGQSILHVSVDAINFSAVDSLIKLNYAKELIDVGDDVNMTPMHIAAINFDIHIYESLISLKPNLKLKDNEGKTCIDYLKENEDVEVPKKFLREDE